MRIFICIMVFTSWIFIFALGINVGKAQIVKEALSKIPHGKIDLLEPKNQEEFSEMLQKFKAGEE